VTLSHESASPVTVTVNTVDGTALVSDNDYQPIVNLLLTFDPGETSKTVTVQVNGDTVVEPDESVHRGPLQPQRRDDRRGDGNRYDSERRRFIGDRRAGRRQGGRQQRHYAVHVHGHAHVGDTSGSASVQYTVAGSGDNPAAANDFDGNQLPSGTVQFAPGETSQTITILVAGDTVVEPDETFTVTLSNPSGATIDTATATGRIINDDSATLSINDVMRAEGNSGTTEFVFTVTLSHQSALPVTVTVNTVDGTALVSDNDYQPIVNLLLTFDPGETSKTVTVLVNGDTAGRAGRDVHRGPVQRQRRDDRRGDGHRDDSERRRFIGDHRAGRR
jgi:U3 small nucleolar ribonucleoprotein component